MNKKSHKKILIIGKYKYHIFNELLPLYPPTYERGQHLHLILTKALQKSRRYFSEMRDDPYIYFSNKQAILLGGRSFYKENFQLLIDLGLLTPVINHNYKNRKQSLMTFEPITLKPILHDQSITYKRINTSLEGYYAARKGDMADVASRFLIPFLRKIKIDITEESFFNHVSRHYLEYVNELGQEHRNQKKKPLSFEAYMESNRYLYLKIQDFKNVKGDEIYDFITQDHFSGRIHSPITILPKYLKHLNIVKYNGESMTELDIKTFQPLLLAIILGDSDFSKWYFSVPDCYLAIQDIFSLQSREAAKTFMYHLLFGTTYGKDHKRFCEKFPEAGRILARWETTFNPDNPNSYKQTKKGIRRTNYHSNVSLLLQKEEVKYMRMIWAMLGRKNISFVTIHDAVLVPTSKADLAQRLIIEKLEMWFKGKARLRRTDLNMIRSDKFAA
jgi:hypothetical protein